MKSRREVAERIDRREQCPGKRELWVKPYRFSEIFLCVQRVGRGVGRFQGVSQTPQVGVISLRIVGRFGSNDLFFLAGKFRLQLLGDGFSHLTLNGKNVGQFAIKAIGPNMGIVGRFDQLHVYAHGVATLLHASFQNVGHAKLLCDLGRFSGALL